MPKAVNEETRDFARALLAAGKTYREAEPLETGRPGPVEMNRSEQPVEDVTPRFESINRPPRGF